jgi:hypothetical protein
MNNTQKDGQQDTIEKDTPVRRTGVIDKVGQTTTRMEENPELKAALAASIDRELALALAEATSDGRVYVIVWGLQTRITPIQTEEEALQAFPAHIQTYRRSVYVVLAAHQDAEIGELCLIADSEEMMVSRLSINKRRFRRVPELRITGLPVVWRREK